MSYVKPSISKRGNGRRPSRQTRERGGPARESREATLLRIMSAPADVRESPWPFAADVEALPGDAAQVMAEFLTGAPELVPAQREPYVPPAGRMGKAELIAAVREYASQPEHLDNPALCWDIVTECWDDARLGEAIGRAQTLDGARKKIEPLIANISLPAT